MTRPLRLTVIVPELLPVPATEGGAVEQWVDEMCGHWPSDGPRLRICSRPTAARSGPGIDNVHIPWTGLERFFSRIKAQSTWRNPLRYLAKIVCVSRYGQRLAPALADSDIVYLHNEPNLLLFIPKRPGQRIVLHMHNDHLSSRAFRPLYRRLLAKVDTVICVSDYIRQCALRHFPEYAHKFEVLFNAVDAQQFKPQEAHTARQALPAPLQALLPPGQPTVLYVGRLVPEKGVDVLIRAFGELKQSIPDARLVVVGSSFFANAARTPYQDALVKLAQPFQNDIVFTGFVPHAQLHHVYALADVVAFPPIWGEPCGLVGLEAMAAGTCLVASAAGGIPEVMQHQVTGLLVPPGDVSALRNALHQALSEPTLRQQWANAARQRILSGYEWRHLMARLPHMLQGTTA